jgi:hypothetical protein
MLNDLDLYWATKFKEYFNDCLKEDLVKKACRFVFSNNLEFDEYSGITTNAAESVNAVLGREISGPISVTEAALILYNLTLRFDYDIDCGMALTGKC